MNTTTSTYYYSDTAYDSTRNRSLAPFDKNRKLAIGERTIRKHPLSIPAGQCREYLARSSAISIVMDFKNQNSKQRQEILNNNLHEYFQWVTTKNKAAIVESIVGVTAYFWIMGIFAVIIVGLVGDFNEAWLMTVGLLVVFPFTIWLIGKYILKHALVKNENNVMFNRRSGMICFPWQDNMISLPFDEFDAYASTSTTVAATTNLFLRLAHRYSDKNIVCPSPFSKGWELYAEWEEIQHFMDISKPLPDVPVYDFARENDPVSAAHDRINNRPKDYWKNSSLDKLREMQMVSINSAETFPWGETREQALLSGWKPSGFGEGNWLT